MLPVLLFALLTKKLIVEPSVVGAVVLLLLPQATHVTVNTIASKRTVIAASVSAVATG